ncbi:hypothetical protein SETIT_7G325700v2 [Setaria italica]|uniref:Uncharacterized protein n=1 Tax=Setaria italica TaxID=4555 RepID=A0A368S280_SETIT|nr:uncharacterized protein LOC101784122 isoform X1 [Setaria italica]RCV36525.1 hypothetical protein SETIT_7G325700v2 [Setaria italica]
MTTTSTSPPSSTSPTSSRTARGGREHAATSPTPSLRGLQLRRDGYTALDYKPQAVDSGGASEDHVSNRFHRQFLLWVVLLTVLLSASTAYSAKNPPKQEGQCRYDLTSIAALSCMQKDAVRRPPSHACCKALLYAVDQVPVEDVSGACCLCRYMKEKVLAAGLATAYILCNGKDSRIVAKWSSFPITRCLDDCGQGNSTSSQAHGTGNREAHVSGMVIWVTVAVLIVIGVICFWYFRRFKAAGNAIQPRAGRRRRSVGPSSAKRKEKRSSSSTLALLKEAKISCHATFVQQERCTI